MKKLYKPTIEKILKEDILKIYEYDLKGLLKVFKISTEITTYDFLKDILYELLFNDNNKIIKYLNKCGEKYYNINNYYKYVEHFKKTCSASNVEYFKILFGENDGIKKHIEFIKKRNNPYKPEYVMKRDNCSYEEACDTIKKIKENKSMTLEGFIKRDGLEKGTEKYNNFLKTSNIYSLENLQRKYGIEEGIKRLEMHKLKAKTSSVWRPEYWMKKNNCTLEEAINCVSVFQKYKSGVSYDAILLRCNNDKIMADELYKMINLKKNSKSFEYCLELCNNDEAAATILYTAKRKKCNNSSFSYLTKEKGLSIEEAYEFRKKRREKSYETLLKNNKLTSHEMYGDYMKYIKKVNFLTKINLQLYSNIINEKTNIKKSLDHKISKFYGFHNNVEDWKIAHIYNLEYITNSQNSKKNINNSQTIEELENKILEFELNNKSIK